MKLSYVLLALSLSCSKAPKVKFPEEQPIMVDPVGPSEKYNEKKHNSKVLDFENIVVMRSLRSIYLGSGSIDTILVIRHTVDKNLDRGWFHAERYLDDDQDGISDRSCSVVGKTAIGGIYQQQGWECITYQKPMSELLQEAERWLKDPHDLRW